MRMSLGKRGWVALAVGAGLFKVLFFSCVETVPKKSQTLTAIYKVSIGVHNFYEANRHLPSNLNQVKIETEFRNDAWGRPIIYTITSSNSWILRSLGPDGRPGKVNVAYSFDPSNIAGTPVQ